jgi:hypothetical protein
VFHLIATMEMNFRTFQTNLVTFCLIYYDERKEFSLPAFQRDFLVEQIDCRCRISLKANFYVLILSFDNFLYLVLDLRLINPHRELYDQAS